MNRRSLLQLLLPLVVVIAPLVAQADDAKDKGIEEAKVRMADAARKAGVSFPLKKPRIEIHKKDRRLDLFDGDVKVKTYVMSLGLAPEGPKRQQGDYKTPEGRYFICYRNYGSAFHLFLGLSYPNAADAAEGLKEKLIDQKTHDRLVEAEKKKRQPSWGTALGGAVGIHGGGVGSDWTWGCIAVEDAEIDELWAAAPWGTPVDVFP